MNQWAFSFVAPSGGRSLVRAFYADCAWGGTTHISLTYVVDNKHVGMGIPSQVFGDKGVRPSGLFLVSNI